MAPSTFRALSAPLVLAGAFALGCGGRPFSEGGSREVAVVTTLPEDSPEVLLLRAIVEREAIRIENEAAYQTRLASPEDSRVYRARTVLFLGYGPRERIPRPLHALAETLGGSRDPLLFSP